MFRDSHERLRNLTSRLMDSLERERSAISRELHDELGRALTRLNIHLRWLLERLPDD
jgi:two-component system sensor histidine kinase UhpB